jgi:hypothetical protein
MTLVRQPAPHDWKGAVDEICATVQAEISMMSQPEPILVESM